MRRHLLVARSLLSLALVLLWLALLSVYQRLIVWPAYLLFPRRRASIVTAFIRLAARGILGWLKWVGGARFERVGRLPTSEPMLALMNHQSLLDIPTAVLLAEPYSPAFVSRDRFARGIPAVSLCLRLLGCPEITPFHDPPRAAEAIARGAEVAEHGLVIFPEGHRSRDGSIRPFRASGAEAALTRRRLPVYLVVTDGFSPTRMLGDFALRVGAVRGRTEVLGPFQPPDDDKELRPFLQDLRRKMVAQQQQMRAASRGDDGD